MTARAVGSPEEAFGLIAGGETFDMLVIDYKMPDMNGLELARRIREQRGDAAPPMVLFTSVAPAERDFWVLVRETGFASLLTKPAKSAQLLNALSAAAGLGPQLLAEEGESASEPTLPDRLSILLVDDNAINLKVGRKVLKKIGYDADLASSGQEAIDRCGTADYDVVLMDIDMPGMDGVEASASIRRNAEGRRRPFIVALTANAMVPDRESYLAAGMDDYLSKPINEHSLVDSLRAAAQFRSGDAGQSLWRKGSAE